MSNVSNGAPRDDRHVARRKQDAARDLEVLVQRLAESREAIVRLLSVVASDDERGVSGRRPARQHRSGPCPSRPRQRSAGR